MYRLPHRKNVQHGGFLFLYLKLCFYTAVKNPDDTKILKTLSGPNIAYRALVIIKYNLQQLNSGLRQTEPQAHDSISITTCGLLGSQDIFE